MQKALCLYHSSLWAFTDNLRQRRSSPSDTKRKTGSWKQALLTQNVGKLWLRGQWIPITYDKHRECRAFRLRMKMVNYLVTFHVLLKYTVCRNPVLSIHILAMSQSRGGRPEKHSSEILWFGRRLLWVSVLNPSRCNLFFRRFLYVCLALGLHTILLTD
jgi:hypothetical protein